MVSKFRQTRTGRWLGVYVGFPLVPPLIEIAMKFLAGFGVVPVGQMFPWVSLIAVFLMATFVVRNEVSKYNIPDAESEDEQDRLAVKSRLDSMLVWLSVLLAANVLLETIVHMRDIEELNGSLILTRVFASIILILTLVRFANAQMRFKLKVAP